MAAEIKSFLEKNPIELYGDGFYCLKDCNNFIDALRGAGLISIATIKVVYGPFWMMHKLFGNVQVRHHASVEVLKPVHLMIDPHAPRGQEVQEVD